MQSNRAHRSQAPTTGQVAREIIKESGYLGMHGYDYIWPALRIDTYNVNCFTFWV